MSNVPKINIVKASGEIELYSRKKFRESLRRAGVGKLLIDETQARVEGKLKEGISTEELYNLAKGFLAEKHIPAAAKYSLKKAIMELGPAGHLFERYFAVVLSEYGYQTQTNLILQGECVTHEIDVFAEKGDSRYFIEAKYHNSRGIKSDVKTALYTYARFLDIKANRGNKFNLKSWLVTNTKFTGQAIKYGECKDIKMTGWGYPKGESLEKLIENKDLYPITVLPAINHYARKQLSEADIYFAKDLSNFSAGELVKKFYIHNDIALNIEKEAKEFINSL